MSGIFVNLVDIDFQAIIMVVGGAWALIVIVRKFLPFLAGRLPLRLRHYILPCIPLFRLAIIAITTVMVLPLIIKPTMQNIIVVLGSIGLAAGFAFKDYVSSLIAGVVAVFEQPYRVGDRVKIDDVYGEVKLVGFRSMRVVTPDDTVVVIPYAKIWNTNIWNANEKGYALCGRVLPLPGS